MPKTATATDNKPGMIDGLLGDQPKFATAKSQARARGRKAPAKAIAKRIQPAPVAAPLMVYTSFNLTKHHQQLLRRVAFHRAELGISRRSDASAVMRDILDFFEAHEDEVLAWADRQSLAPTLAPRRRR